MSKHTPGPWRSNGKSVQRYREGDANTNPRWFNIKPTEANAARIVACVNACEGLEDPSVVPAGFAVMRKLKDWALDVSGDSCECFEQEVVGKDAGGIISRAHGKAGTCLSCCARELLEVIIRAEGDK